MTVTDGSRLIMFNQSELMFAVMTNNWGNKKPHLMARRGDKTVVLLLIFPKLMMLELELAPDIETKVQPVAVVS